MAVFFSNEYKKAFVDKPSQSIEAGKYNGRIRNLYAECQVGAAELTAADSFIVGVLPEGARVVNCRVVSPDWGTTGEFVLGWKANAVDVADADGFLATVDANAAAVNAQMSGLIAGWQKKFSAPTEVELDVIEASTAMAGEVIKVQIEFVVD